MSPDAVETIVVVNNPDDAGHSVRQSNRNTLQWLRATDFQWPCHAIDRATIDNAFPVDRSGVGWARRIGMDLALHRLHEADAPRAIMPCLDGDSPPSRDYISGLDGAFDDATGESPLAGVCRYRHPLPADRANREAIAVYESWMRYFEAGLHLAGSPYAYQAIGSCMAISAGGYALADGVPTRRALSDFYLLQKIIKAGGPGAVRHIRRATVYPSARPSLRVPRGTGPSVDETMRARTDQFRLVEPSTAFDHLRDFFDALESGFADLDALKSAATPLLETFLDRWSSWETIDRIRRHAPDPARFKQSFFEWFDGLKTVQFAHDCRNELGGENAFTAAERVTDALGMDDFPAPDRGTTPDTRTTEDWTALLSAWRAREWQIRRHSDSPTSPPDAD